VLTKSGWAEILMDVELCVIQFTTTFHVLESDGLFSRHCLKLLFKYFEYFNDF